MRMMARSIVGSPETVRAGIAALVAETQADELMIVTDIYDQAARRRALDIIGDVASSGRERARGIVARGLSGPGMVSVPRRAATAHR